MFLNRLKGNNATIIAIAASKNLIEAIIAAKRVENRKIVQQQMGNELNDLKKSIEGLVVNYVTLFAQIKDTRIEHPCDNFYRRHPYDNDNNKDWSLNKRIQVQRNGPQCYNCGEFGHYTKNCLSKEIYNLENEKLVKRTVKHPTKPEWNERLRKRKLVNILQHEIGDECKLTMNMKKIIQPFQQKFDVKEDY
ncbi:29470_t:CDS:2 [Gigaspora margarita]|uniref:29470_t:CDS:1 n=1 Tax=Gigaspora margarita TaxID=4874 RepID=A0ABN7VDN8_GIGMA|nr:29470_t:CDS:2 [Gigaspora margarita]